MKKIKVSEATPIQLNYLVAKCQGHQVGIITAEEQWGRFIDRATAEELAENAAEFAEIRACFKTAVCKIHDDGYKSEVDARDWRYSTDWSQGGPIIERERIVCDFYNHIVDGDDQVHARLCRAKLKPDGTSNWYAPKRGPTILIAAMRCYVASKLGGTVEVPDEICD